MGQQPGPHPVAQLHRGGRRRRGAAVRDSRRLSIRSGGHCYENFVDHADVRAIIDMTQMKAVEYDPARRAVMVESGATLGEAYYTLFKRWGDAASR